MHLLGHLSTGLVVIILLLVFVAPFIDLPISRRLEAKLDRKDRLRLYRVVIVYLWLMAGLAWIYRDGTGLRVAHAAGDAAWMFGAAWRTWAIAAAVALFFVVALKPGVDCLLRPRRIPAYTRAMKKVGWVLPQDRQQRRWFALLSVSAGVCEEWILRGVVPHCLHMQAGLSVTAALLVSSALFGWNHLYQGWRGVGSTALIGFMFGLVALLSGGLLLPILLHCAMDLQVVVSFRPDKPVVDPGVADGGLREAQRGQQ